MNIPMSETEHMILRAKMVLPMQGPPIEDGAVVVREGRILSVGRWAELESPPAGQVRDLGEQVLLPGLINAHCHLDYSCMKGRVPYAHSFIEWILALVQLKAATTDGEYLEGFNGGLAELLGAGTTTVLNVSAFPRFVDRIDNPGLRLLWCFELLDFNQPESAETQLQNVEAFIDAHPELLGQYGFAPHAPYSTSEGLYVLASRAATARGCVLTTHLAESVEEDDMFRRGQGHMFDYFQRQGRDMSDCKHQGVFQLLADWGVLGPRCLLAHVNHPTRRDLELIAESGAHVVHCPKSHRFFDRDIAPLQLFLAHSINVCLGTDSLASNDTLNLFKEMHTLALTFPEFSAEQILAMATTAPARALGRESEIGSLAPGALADLVTLPLQADSPDPYESVVYAEQLPTHVIVGGEFLVG